MSCASCASSTMAWHCVVYILWSLANNAVRLCDYGRLSLSRIEGSVRAPVVLDVYGWEGWFNVKNTNMHKE